MPAPQPHIADLRRHAVARSLLPPSTLKRVIQRLGFVQADPIRAPARAQDLTLRHRVSDYRAGDLEALYPRLGVEEDCLVNYGFVTRAVLPLLHPRTARRAWDATTRAQADEVLAFVQAQGPTHPKDVQAAFNHGTVKGYWGADLNASTHLLDGMHYRGLLRVSHRVSGTRVYEAVEHQEVDDSPDARAARADALVALILAKYAPLPARSFSYLVQLLGYGAPQLKAECRAALARARRTLPTVQIDGVDWYWPEGENPRAKRWAVADEVRLLAPFDPVVWDRGRFELLWDWPYRLEAYTPAPKRQYGHYALPLLWRDAVVGWANVGVKAGGLTVELGYVAGQAPADAAYAAALDDELQRMSTFLGL